MPMIRVTAIAIAHVLLLAAAPALGFGFEDVSKRAQKLAGKAYRKPDFTLPAALADLTYDQYRDIRFKPERALWHGKLPFEIQFFHLGLYYTLPVRVNLLTAQGVKPVELNPDDFDYGKNDLDPKKLGDIGFAGFRIHFPLNKQEYKDELAVFLGASYFRALGEKQRYGLSARGLAVDTALLSGEEFPRFSEYWVEWPRADARELTIYALLDSRRVTGAYRFQIRPGTETQVDVQSRLFLREAVGKLGIAPMTSMYFTGENQRAVAEDYRPEVHDSDGLMMETGSGEWLWRPLVNPQRLLVTTFATTNPRGFGLMQRDRMFAHYEDLEARYDVRPSAWVQPKGDWGPGRVELVTIPTPDETNDNIVAFWVPDKLPPLREPLDLQYRVSWQMAKPARPPQSWVVQTRRGHGYRRAEDDSLLYLVDFEGPALQSLAADAPVKGVVSVGDNGELLESQAYRNEVTGGWRLAIRVQREDPARPLEMRAHLRHDDDAISETWSYILPPE